SGALRSGPSIHLPPHGWKPLYTFLYTILSAKQTYRYGRQPGIVAATTSEAVNQHQRGGNHVSSRSALRCATAPAARSSDRGRAYAPGGPGERGDAPAAGTGGCNPAEAGTQSRPMAATG